MLPTSCCLTSKRRREDAEPESRSGSKSAKPHKKCKCARHSELSSTAYDEYFPFGAVA